ncbi:MAG: 3-hydroxyacyl-CoA dehydrogenase family protein [Coprococcus sp.]|nr:3-hydroxyacyl-CoA dehydrogenase family protein [Coprococcus sp.]
MKKIGVIGAGVMGTGVAQRFAQYGYEIILVDVAENILESSKKTIERNVMFHNMMNKEKLDQKAIIERIHTQTSYQALEDADIIIENIPEIIEQKLNVYEQLTNITKEECFYLVNTSCIPIKRIADVVKQPEKVIGVHFMNPVPLQNFAEVIKTSLISEGSLNLISEFLKQVKIDCTAVNDSPGFVSNRLSHLFMNEAANLVMEGIATPEQVDMIFTRGFHHEIGPLYTADLIGIDTVVNSLDVLYECYKEDKYKCSQYMRDMVENGELGRKTGKGFFKY